MQPKTQVIYDKLPDLADKEHIYFISSVAQIKHAPDDTKPETMEEFLKVCKTYHEIGINTKIKRVGGFTHNSYRCLFSDPKQAQKAQNKINAIWENYKKQQAIKAFERSKYKEEMFNTIGAANEF